MLEAAFWGAVGGAWLRSPWDLPRARSRSSSATGRSTTAAGITERAAGYALLADASGDSVGFIQAFAAGAVLTMLADTMMPDALEHGGRATGLVTAFGFAGAFLLSMLG